MIKIYQDRLFQIIFKTIRKIDEELNSLNKTGIFFAPELYVAFEIGKALLKNYPTVFGTETIKWVREKNLGNGGPSDISFEYENETIVFELKMANTSTSYSADINKLKRLSERYDRTYHKFFICLVDSFRINPDDRLLIMEKGCMLLSQYKDSFQTSYSRNIRDVNCFVAVYHVE